METMRKLEKNGIVFSYDDIERICKKYKIIEVSIFGSSLREDFKDDSDVDILIEYSPNAEISLFDEIDISDELSELVNREVHLTDIEELKNPIRRKCILETREVVYENS